MKKVTIETVESKEYFEIEEYSGKQLVYKFDYSGFWSKKTKVGEAKSLDDAITIAKSYVSGRIKKIDIR